MKAISTGRARIVDYLVGAVALRDAVRGVCCERSGRARASWRRTRALTSTAANLSSRRRSGATDPAECWRSSICRVRKPQRFRSVIIDTVRFLAVSDTLLMTPHVQSVASSCTPRKLPATRSNARSHFSAPGSRPAGVILNRLREARAGYLLLLRVARLRKGEGSYTGYSGATSRAPTRRVALAQPSGSDIRCRKTSVASNQRRI